MSGGASHVTAQPADTGSDDAALQALKSLLLNEEKAQIEHLAERLEDPSLRTEDVADVLPDAILHSDRQGPELTEALSAPVTRCIESSVRQNPENFANALYPVMGPAIRQSISNTLRGLLENINRTLEHSLSIQGFKWRLEAMRSGVPFGEVVLRHTLVYRVEQVFLIQPESGLLMQHVADDTVVESDPDAISGMLTAITQFVRDAFKAEQHEGLETVELGDHTVILAHGPHAYLAAVVRGIAPSSLREHCQGILEKLHARHAEPLQAFDGDTRLLEPARPLLGRCLLSQQREDRKPRRGLSPALLVILLLILALAGWWAYHAWQAQRMEQQRLNRQHTLVERLRATPGIVVTEARYGPVLALRGLRDPLAPPLDSVLGTSGLPPDTIETAFSPYLDLSPELVLARARHKLQPPERVRLKLAGRTLVAAGIADEAWRQRLRLQGPLLPGVDAIDDRSLKSSGDWLIQQARKRLAPLPKTVKLQLQGKRLLITGQAPLAWIGRIDTKLDGLPLEAIDSRGLTSQEARRFDILSSQIDGTAVYFETGARLGEEQQRQLQILAGDLRELDELGKTLGRRFHLLIVGRADGVGPAARNQELALTRARTVHRHLTEAGVVESLLQTTAEIATTPDFDPLLRRAEFRIVTETQGD